jgi:hypothetical protein
MTEVESLKAQVHECLSGADASGGLDEDRYTRLMSLIDELSQRSPYVAAERPDVVAGSWETLFASFGARHSSGKTVRHAADLQIHSLGKLPKAPIQVLAIIQEIDERGDAYNNVVEFECGEAATPGRLIMRGRFSCATEAPIRYQVGFYRAEAHPRDGASESALREGWASTAPSRWPRSSRHRRSTPTSCSSTRSCASTAAISAASTSSSGATRRRSPCQPDQGAAQRSP